MKSYIMLLFIITQCIIVYSQQEGGIENKKLCHVKPDSLLNLIIAKSSPKTLKKINDLKPEVKFDSLIHNLQDTIIAKIGEELFCNNILLKYDGFRFQGNCDQLNIVMGIFLYLKLPQIKEDSSHFDIYDHYVSISCGFNRKSNGKIEINYPYLPKMINNDFNFNISKYQAIELAKSSGFIKDGEKYNISIVANDFDYSNGYTYMKYAWEIRKGDWVVKIDITNGEMSKIHRIGRQ